MTKQQVRTEAAEVELAITLEHSVDAALNLGLTERELLERISHCIHAKTPSETLLQMVVHRMSNPEAGP